MMSGSVIPDEWSLALILVIGNIPNNAVYQIGGSVPVSFSDDWFK